MFCFELDLEPYGFGLSNSDPTLFFTDPDPCINKQKKKEKP
jgi:hypothetical protein